MTAFHFANPEALALLVTVPLMAAAYRYGDRHRRAAIEAWGRAPVAVADGRRRALQRGMHLAACAALAIALARPALQSTGAPPAVPAPAPTGDLVFLLDVSRSMLADDVRPSRLDRARDWIKQLAAQAKGQRLGLVAFAGSQALQCPLTLDRAFFEEMVDSTGPDSVARGGTKLGDAIRFAAGHAFDDVDRDDKTLVLISDGEDQENSPAAAASDAAGRGIHVVAIGVGDPAGGALVPESMDDRTPVVYRGRPVATRLDEATLGAIAAASREGAYRQASVPGYVAAYVPARTGALDAAQVYGRFLTPARRSSKRPIESGDTAWMACLAVGILLLGAEFRVPERRLWQAAVLALALLAMPVASFAQTVEEWFGKGVKALEERKYQDAVHYFAEAARMSPGVPEIRFNLGKALYGFQFYNEAAESFEMAANSARGVQLKARCKLGQGNALFRDAEQLPGTQAVERMKGAIAAYKDAQALDPQLVDAEYNRKVAERRLQEKVLQAVPPGRAPSPAAAEPDAERVLKEMRRPVAAGTRAKDRAVERDW